jgi:hypothetical protein
MNNPRHDNAVPDDAVVGIFSNGKLSVCREQVIQDGHIPVGMSALFNAPTLVGALRGCLEYANAIGFDECSVEDKTRYPSVTIRVRH